MNFFKKTLLGVSISLLSVHAIANVSNDYIIRVPTPGNVDFWVTQSSAGPWQNSGSLYDCGDWSPLASEIASGQSFLQARTCSQNQNRTVSTSEVSSLSNETRSQRSYIQNRTIEVADSRSSVGVSQSGGSGGAGGISGPGQTSVFTAWVTFNINNGDWTPEISNQTVGFNQVRSRTLDQEQFEQIQENENGEMVDVGSPIRHVRTVADSNESRFIDVTEGPLVEGTEMHSCSPYFPNENDVPNGHPFVKTRMCLLTDSVTYTYSVGGEYVKYTDRSVEDIAFSRGTGSGANCANPDGIDGEIVSVFVWDLDTDYDVRCEDGTWTVPEIDVNDDENPNAERDYQLVMDAFYALYPEDD